METLRVILGPHRPSGSGVASYTRHLLKSLIETGHHVSVFGYGLDDILPPDYPEVETLELGNDPERLDLLTPMATYFKVRRDTELAIRHLGGDVVHIPYPPACPRRTHLPTVVTGWSYGDLREGMLQGWKGFSGPMRVVAPVGYAVYHLEDKDGYRAADLVLFTTRASEQYWREFCRRSAYMPCPVGVAPESAPSSARATGEGRISMIVGERDLSRPRNHVRNLLRACRSLKSHTREKFELTLIGGGSRGIREEIRKCTEEGVRLCCRPYLSRSEFGRLLDSSDVCIQIREILDQGGYLSLEAMAKGKVVVVSRSPAFADYVDPGVTGLTVDPDSIESIASVIEELALDPEGADRIGKRARKFTEENHSYRAVGSLLTGFYTALLNR